MVFNQSPLLHFQKSIPEKQKSLKSCIFKLLRLFILPAAGLEPARGYPQQILSLHRLPFRHAGIVSQRLLFYHKRQILASAFLFIFSCPLCMPLPEQMFAPDFYIPPRFRPCFVRSRCLTPFL